MTDQPILQNGSKGDAVRRLQASLGVAVDGDFGDGTEDAVADFQAAHGLDDDGVVGPRTWALLPVLAPGDSGHGASAPAQSGHPDAVTTGLHSQLSPTDPPAPKAPPPPPQPFIQLGRQVGRLVEGDIDIAASTLGCEPAWVHAVVEVESGGRSGFLPAPDLRPVILFESHQFHVLTGGRFDAIQPNLSTDSRVRNYGPSGTHQYDRLNMAMRLDAEAALKSASWGMFQIMGSNFAICGYESVDRMVADMQRGEAQHLQAFVNFCRKTGAARYLAAGSPAGFARIYNGPGYAANSYDVLLQQHHDAWARRLAAVRGA